MSVNLNEFSEEQLQYAIDVFKDKETDHNYHISRISIWEESTIKEERLSLAQSKFDTAILFRIQLENALEEVQRKDKTLSN